MMENGDNSLQYLHPTPPSLRDVLQQIGPFPQDALFMGVVIEDALPFMFDTSVMHSKDHVLIQSDDSAMLHTIVDAMRIRNSELDYIVISSKAKWQHNPRIVLTTNPTDSEMFLNGSRYWIRTQKTKTTPFLIFMDGLEGIERLSDEAQLSFNWILRNGIEYRTFIIARVSPSSHYSTLGFNVIIEYDENRQLYKFGGYHVWSPEDK